MTYPAEVLADTPLVYWRLADAAATAADSSGNGRAGTIGSVVVKGVASLLTGDSDLAVSFPGTTSSATTHAVLIADATWMHPTTITVECLVKPVNVTAGERVIAGRYVMAGSATAANRSWGLYQNGADLSVAIAVSGGTTLTTATATGVLAAGVTAHVAFTYDGTTLRLYVNGAEVATAAVSGTLNPATLPLVLGNNNGVNDRKLVATLDEFSMYGTALTAARITAHYNAAAGIVPTPPPPPSPIVDGQARITRITHRITGDKWLTTFGFTVEGGVAQPQVTPSPTPSGGKTLSELLRPVGEVTMWYGATTDIPAGWLRCDGTAIPADYPDLIALIGANTPNMVDVFPIGAGTKAKGTTGGDPTKVIAEANLPAHSHPYTRRSGASALGTAASAAAPSATGTVETGNTSNTGSGTPLDVMNPWRALHFIIRAR